MQGWGLGAPREQLNSWKLGAAALKMGWGAVAMRISSVAPLPITRMAQLPVDPPSSGAPAGTAPATLPCPSIAAHSMHQHCQGADQHGQCGEARGECSQTSPCMPVKIPPASVSGWQRGECTCGGMQLAPSQPPLRGVRTLCQPLDEGWGRPPRPPAGGLHPCARTSWV